MISLSRSLRRFGFASSRPSDPLRILLRSFAQPAKAGGDESDEEAEMIDPRRLPADYDPSNFDPAEHRSPPTPRVFRLVDEVAGLTLSEVSELSSIIASKLGLKELPVIAAMDPGAASAPATGAAAGPAAEEEKKTEKTVFEVRLESYEAASKIKVIKEVRAFAELGLKEAKELVEKTPAVFKRGVSKEEGEQIIEKMKAIGAKAVLE
ncbi:50S ribosomal protein L12, cyanelle [Acorus calamus]|uniref:50S ribosomal protein L12, cyanelle n=1 Tax=Acorus calamus TaxID=4465 RepID=A0AAV9DUC3_ACOCL|nr:50S ribosomal protein L12, cyanelle [Acorus calamus]